MKGLTEATMLYRKGTEARIHDVHVDTLIVDAHEVEDMRAEGWCRTPAEAQKAWEDAQAASATKSKKKGEDAPADPAASGSQT